MKPFDTFPHQGLRLLGGLKEDKGCRHGYGLTLRKETGQTICAYCDMNLIDTFGNWLFMSVDHIVPKKAAESKGIPKHFIIDMANCVLCCRACNEFGNRGCPEINDKLEWKSGWGEAEFIDLRNRVFLARLQFINQARTKEEAKYDNQIKELDQVRYQMEVSVDN